MHTTDTTYTSDFRGDGLEVLVAPDWTDYPNHTWVWRMDHKGEFFYQTGFPSEVEAMESAEEYIKTRFES